MHVLYLTEKNSHSRKYKRQGTEYKRWRNRGLDTEEQRTGTQSHRLIQCYLWKASLIWLKTLNSPFKIIWHLRRCRLCRTCTSWALYFRLWSSSPPTSRSSRLSDRSDHRVDRVPWFLTSRPNWLPLPPHLQASVAPPPFGSGRRGGHTFACGRGDGGSQL